MMKVLFLERVKPDVLEIVKSCIPQNLELITLRTDDEEEKFEKVVDADFILVGPSPVTEQLLARGKKLRLVQKTGVGLDKINLKAASEKGIMVANAGATNAIAVAEHTILLILAIYKKLPIACREFLAERRWTKWDYRCSSSEIYDKTVGIIGMGNIGKETAKRLRCLGCKILYYDLYRLSIEEEEQMGFEYANLHQLLQSSDIVSLHTTLNENTYHMISEKELALMKNTAIFINTARGALVDEEALYKALIEKTIAGAGLDVFEKEPPDYDNPFFTLANVIVTPHIGGGTRETIEKIYLVSFNNMLRVLEGLDPFNKVN